MREIREMIIRDRIINAQIRLLAGIPKRDVLKSEIERIEKERENRLTSETKSSK